MFFSYDDFGHKFELFTLQHLLATLIFLILPVVLLLVFKNKIINFKKENLLRISIGVFGIAFELSLYAWYVIAGNKRDVRDIIATTLCGLSVYLGNIAMITLNKKIAALSYYYSYGAIFSFLLADVLHGFDRFRFYTFCILHGLIIFNVFYLRMIHKVKYDKKAFVDASILLFAILIITGILNKILDMNFFYLEYPLFDDFPVYTYLFETNLLLYSVAVSLSYFILMGVMLLISKFLKTDKD